MARRKKKFKRLDVWKAEIAEQYGTQPRFVVRNTTFAARGHAQRGRQLLAEIVTSRGSTYLVYAEETAVQIRKAAKRRGETA